jgi:hypothetical protein
MNTIQEYWQQIIAVGAAVGFLYGVYRYVKAQRWQKAQIVLDLMSLFQKNEKVQTVCKMLDWDKRTLTIDGTTLVVDNEHLLKSLQVGYWDIEGAGYTKEQVVTKDAFDAFFDFFDKLYAFRKSDLLEMKDLSYFYYWFRRILDMEQEDNTELQNAILKYAETYKCHGFLELLKEYRPTHKSLELWRLEGST